MSVYACSNLEDDLNKWNTIKDFLQTDDTLFILGDSISTHKEGYNILSEALNMPNVIYLLGDNEKMMIDGIKDYLNGGNILKQYYFWVFNNRGKEIFNQWQTDQDKALILSKLEQCSYGFLYKKIFLSHAGSSKIIYQSPELLYDKTHITAATQDDIIAVHGHISTKDLVEKLFLSNDFNHIVYYQNNTKININVKDDKVHLLDLNTLEEIII